MYWYYKYPFCVIAAAMVFGIGYFIWQRLPVSWTDRLTFRQEAVSPTGDDVKRPAGTGNTPGQVARHAKPSIAEIIPQRLASAREQLQRDNPLAARTLARKVLDEPTIMPFRASWFEAAEIISKANTKLINSDVPAPEKIEYVIKQGDVLTLIAKKFNTTIEALQRGNGLEPNNPVIYPGDVLRIYQGDWNILVLKPEFVLILFNGQQIFKVYRVGIGRQNRTPVGVFTVKNKLKEPVWTPPGRVIAYGDPENVLGTRWLGLQPIEDTSTALRGYGIHGTWMPETIGTAASEGCVRMVNDEVNELYDIVPVGTRVVIKDE